MSPRVEMANVEDESAESSGNEQHGGQLGPKLVKDLGVRGLRRSSRVRITNSRLRDFV